MSAAAKIIEGLKDAIAGNFASVTIEGQHWVRREWQPMESAPRDGRSILACDATTMDSCQVVGFDDRGENGFVWCADDAGHYHEKAFSHWMPLPDLPKA